jgi:hypothetical protein
MYYSYSLSFRISGLLRDPLLQEKIDNLRTNIAHNKTTFRGVTLLPESLIMYFISDPNPVSPFVLQEMFDRWSKSVSLQRGTCSLSGDRDQLVQPSVLDSSVKMNLCIKNWIKTQYPAVWKQITGIVEPEESKPKEESYSLIHDGEETEMEMEVIASQLPFSVRILWLLHATLNEDDYKEFASTFMNLSKACESIQKRSHKLGKPPEAFLDTETLSDLRNQIQTYNAHCIGYQLLCPHPASVKGLLKTKTSGTTQSLVYPSPDVHPFLSNQAKQSAILLHKLNPIQVPLSLAIKCEKESMLTNLNSFRDAFGKWRMTKLKSGHECNILSELPLKLQTRFRGTRLQSFQIGSIRSPKLPSSVLLPLFSSVSLEYTPNKDTAETKMTSPERRLAAYRGMFQVNSEEENEDEESETDEVPIFIEDLSPYLALVGKHPKHKRCRLVTVNFS